MAHCVDYFRINDFIKPVQACTIGPGRPAEPIRHTVAAGRHLGFRRRPDMTSLKVAPHPVYLDPYQIWWRSAQPRPSYDHFCIFKMAARRHVFILLQARYDVTGSCGRCHSTSIPNFVQIGRSAAEIWWFPFFKMATRRHLGFRQRPDVTP